MRKILISLLVASAGTTAFAANNLFQQFDNQYNLGYGISQTNLTATGYPNAQVTNQTLSLEVERLFDMGLWFDVDAQMATSSLTNQSVGVGASGTNALNQAPTLGGINGKLGYAFSLAHQHVALSPYLSVGRNSDLAASTVSANNGLNLTQDYDMSAGFGGHAEFRLNHVVDMYLDEGFAYNWDMSNPVTPNSPQDTISLTTTLGMKFNVYKNFQVGVNGFYNKIYDQFCVSCASQPWYEAQDGFGGMLRLGLTY